MKRARFGLWWSAALCALLLSACGPGGPKPSIPSATGEAGVAARPTPTRLPDDQPDNPIVGQSGGQAVRLSEILALERGTRFGPPPSGRPWRDVVREFRTAKLDDMLLAKALIWKMDQAGLRPRVEAEVAKMMATEGEDGLRQRGLTIESLSAFVAKSMLQEPGLAKLPQVSDTDMRAYYEQHKTDRFLTKERLSIRRIWRFPKPGLDKDALRAEMEELRGEIAEKLAATADVNAEAVIVSGYAKQYHEGRDRATGGWIEHYRPAPTNESPAYLEAAFNAELYKLSPVLEVDGGYLLVFPDAHYGRRQISYEESRNQILNMIVKERKEGFEADWKRRLLDEAGTATYLDSLMLHLPPEPPAEPAAPPTPATSGGA